MESSDRLLKVNNTPKIRIEWAIRKAHFAGSTANPAAAGADQPAPLASFFETSYLITMQPSEAHHQALVTGIPLII
jgi:hypothetical protein